MFTDVTDLCDSEAEDGDLDLESTATLLTQGDVPQALGTVVCQSDLRRRLQGERHLVKQGGSTASAHLRGWEGEGADGFDCEGIVTQCEKCINRFPRSLY